jgi:hypothetical protein
MLLTADGALALELKALLGTGRVSVYSGLLRRPGGDIPV